MKLRNKVCGLVFLQLSLAAQNIGDLDGMAESYRAKQGIPGIVLTVVRGDQVVYAKGFGAAGVETGEPVTPDHLFRAGSTTKMFVASAVLRLSELDKVRMGEAVGIHLRDLDPAIAALTAHQLLSHTSGLTDLTLMYGRHDDPALAENARGLRADDLFTKPGAIYSYSNRGYVMAGRLVESVTGLAFADAMTELVFAPLGMKRTTFRPTIAMTYPLAQGHQKENGVATIVRPAADHSGYWPAGSMFTSGRDFARMAIALMNEGRVEGKTALSAALVREMLTPRVDVPSSSGGSRYGYGLTFPATGGDPIVEHGGSRLGYTSHLLLVPSKKTGVVVLGNLSGGNVAGLAKEVIARLIGSSKESGPAAPAKLSPSSLAGFYTHGAQVATVRAEDGKLLLDQDGRASELSASGGNCFALKLAGRVAGSACFTLGPDGRAQYLTLGGRSLARR